jgi:hypothetical protein
MTPIQIPKLPNPNDFHNVDELRMQLSQANETIATLLENMADMIDKGKEFAAAHRLIGELMRLQMQGDSSGISQILTILVMREKLAIIDRSNDVSATAARRAH